MPVSLAQGNPTTVLSAVTVATKSAIYAVQGVPARIPTVKMQVSVTATITTLTVSIDGSEDGVTFFPMDSMSVLTGGMVFSIGKAPRFVQANVSTLTGGGTVTVILGVV